MPPDKETKNSNHSRYEIESAVKKKMKKERPFILLHNFNTKINYGEVRNVAEQG